MRGVNKCIIVGNCGQDPETRTSPDGGQVTNITVATSESWKDRKTGQPQERTEWHRVVFNGRLADIAAQYLRKGSKVYLEGSLRTRKWQDKNTGQEKYSTEIVAREMQMLERKQDNAEPNMNQAPQQQPAPQAPKQAQGMQQPQQGGYTQAPGQPPAQPQSTGTFDDLDDGIPV